MGHSNFFNVASWPASMISNGKKGLSTMRMPSGKMHPEKVTQIIAQMKF